MCIHLPFDFKKATQALNFFAQKSGGKINKLKALKLVYFADRYHLRKYGRPITNDEYYAMQYGPVASGVKDLAEKSEFLGDREEDYSSRYVEPLSNHMLKSISDVDEDVFSDSDIEALNFSWRTFGRMNQYKLADFTHLYPDWKKHEVALEHLSRVRMRYEDFLEDPSSAVEKCFELENEEKYERKEYLKEISRLESLWK